jgi:uncharacterized damage-inducible protein DinB
MHLHQFSTSEYDESTAYYLDLVPSGNFLDLLEQSRQETMEFFSSIPDEKHEFSYAPGKWTIKDVLQHMIDVERIFAYRALRFARGETQPLCGFDVDDYGAAQRASRRPLKEILEEYSLTRQSTIQLFRSFDEVMLLARGLASGMEVSVRVLGHKLIGHDRHHCGVIRDRYLDQ